MFFKGALHNTYWITAYNFASIPLQFEFEYKKKNCIVQEFEKKKLLWRRIFHSNAPFFGLQKPKERSFFFSLNWTSYEMSFGWKKKPNSTERIQIRIKNEDSTNTQICFKIHLYRIYIFDDRSSIRKKKKNNFFDEFFRFLFFTSLRWTSQLKLVSILNGRLNWI